jgi:hypothetical protein
MPPKPSYFIVGCRPLNFREKSAWAQPVADQGEDIASITHACIAIADNDDFDDCNILEYDEDGWHERKKVGLTSEFNWHKLGDTLSGMSPYPYKYVIDNLIGNEEWTGKKYSKFNHNCHDFVEFVLYVLGFNGGKWEKGFKYCYAF